MDQRSAYARDAERMRKEYVESRVASAHPVEVVAMLFEVAMASLNDAIGCLKTGDRFARSGAVTRAEQAIQELIFALDHSVSAKFSRTAEDLYRYILARIVAGHARESEREFRDALAVLTPLAGAWAEVKRRLTEDPQRAADAPAENEKEAQAVRDPYAAYRQSPTTTPGRDWSC